MWSYHAARVISAVFSPAVVLPIGGLYMAWRLDTKEAWLWTLFYSVAAIAVPVSYIIWRIRLGKLTDFHMRLREQRVVPMVVIIACVAITWVVMLAGGAPDLLLIALGIASLLAFFLTLITLRWKISVHSCVNTAVWLTAWGMFGLFGWLAVVVVLLVVWARVRVRRHTIMQTLAGVVIGLTFGTAALILWGAQTGSSFLPW